jgi:ubiquinone/menaquinone biosynthesis C-methylase UbiE
MSPSHPTIDVCPHWLSALIDNPLRRWLHDPETLFAGLLEPGQTALDLGCGPGTFTLALARCVGPGGRVIAVDLQPRMLARLRAKAEKAGLLERIDLHLCSSTALGLGSAVQADFALAFWMVHEVPDPERFLAEVLAGLRPGGRLLLVEPLLHVSAEQFARTLELARAGGWRLEGPRAVRISRAALLCKENKE